MPCCHVYHRHCITRWPQESNTCSCCRYELVGGRYRWGEGCHHIILGFSKTISSSPFLLGSPCGNNSFTLPRRGYVPAGRNFSCARPWQQHAYFSTSSPLFTWRGSNLVPTLWWIQPPLLNCVQIFIIFEWFKESCSLIITLTVTCTIHEPPSMNYCY